MATSVKPTECGVCQEGFDEDSRCPRIFNYCFHTLCSICITQLIKNNTKQCPFCRRGFKANIANHVMVNHTMLELMRHTSHQESNSKTSKKVPATPRERRINDFKEEIKKTRRHHHVNCKEAQKQIEKTINQVINLQKTITQENICIENVVLPKLHDVISRNNRRVKYLDKRNKTLHIQLKKLKEKNKKLDVKGKLHTCTANSLKETVSVLDEVEAIGEWIANVKHFICEEEKILQTTEKKMKRTKEQINIVLEVLNSQEETDEEETDEEETDEEETDEEETDEEETDEEETDEEETDEEEIEPIPGMAAMSIQEELLTGHLTVDILLEMSDPVKHLVEQGRIFAIQQRQGRRRCARISLTDEKLYLHHLKEEPLPQNAYSVEHDDLMRLVGLSSRLTFLELTVDGSTTLGRLYIRINNTKGAQHFSCLCTGEKGTSYANTNILEVCWKGHDMMESVRVGDYERNNGSGGKEVMQGMSKVEWRNRNKGEYNQPWLAGSVEGYWGFWWDDAKAAQFFIFTRDSPGKRLFGCLGIVEDGLSVLTEAISHYPNIRDVIIKDCGIALSC